MRPVLLLPFSDYDFSIELKGFSQNLSELSLWAEILVLNMSLRFLLAVGFENLTHLG